MSLYVASLNSGSNGNCYYVGTRDEGILVDAGISCRETEKRMKRLGLSLKHVKAIFVSHEHRDHIYGIPTLAKKHQLPIYITNSTLQHGRLIIKEHLINTFRAYEPVKIGNLTVTAFPKLHDASDPHSFIVASPVVKVGIFTDIGLPCEHVIRNFQQCNAAFLEANYDEELLETGTYSFMLKNRIRGGKGHLSNRQALQLFVRHKPSFMSLLLLSHLSHENNRPEIVQDLFRKKAGKTEIVVASRHEETQLFYIKDHISSLKSRAMLLQRQLSLFQ